MNTCETCAAMEMKGCRNGVGIWDDEAQCYNEPQHPYGCTLWEGKPLEFETRTQLAGECNNAAVIIAVDDMRRGRKVRVRVEYIDE